MRILLLVVVMLALIAPSAWPQELGSLQGSSEARVLTDREARAILLAPLAAERLPAEIVAAPARRDDAAADVASADRSSDFLYQIVLTAVSALVTALIWKAVFD
jgi:hypothetical protein